MNPYASTIAALAPAQLSLRDHAARAVRRYLQDLGGQPAEELHALFLREVEAPLFAEVLQHCDYNQSRAAAALGIHRATLRTKLRQYGIAELGSRRKTP